MKFELHITIPPEKVAAFKKFWPNSKVLTFKNTTMFGTKAITDVMTSEQLCQPSLDSALEVVAQRVSQLEAIGIPALRTKLEVAPWEGVVERPDQYFETHSRLFGAGYGGPGMLKSVDVVKGYRYLTLRSTPGQDQAAHMRHVNAVVQRCMMNNTLVEAIDAELVIHDSNRAHDKEWEDGN